MRQGVLYMTRIGVVGLGYWGSKVVEEYVALRNNGDIDAVIACDVDEERLISTDGVDVRNVDLSSTLERIDGLHICTPIGTHADLAVPALQAGVDVLIEKPFTDNRSSAFDLMQLASCEDRIIQIGHIYRFANVIERLRELHNVGRFGELQTITMRWTHQVDPPAGTDVLWDLAAHPIDILNYVTGEWPSNEYCRSRTRPSADGPVGATAQFRLGSTDVTMQLSWDDWIRRRTIELVGTEASALVKAVDQNIVIYDEDGTERIPVEANNTIRREAANFVEAIRTRRNTANSAVIGVRTVEAIERLENSLL